MASTELNRTPSLEEILKILQGFPIDLQKIYPQSFLSTNGLFYGMIRSDHAKKLIVIGEKEPLLKDPFVGKIFHHSPSLKMCDLSLDNTLCLMERFPFTKPTPLLNHPATIGTGDRLGLATPGHIRAIKKFKVRPVLAQQSVRENSQTGRSFKEVIADAAWAVFQEGFREGYGADGDHLKSLDEVRTALDAGVSMITLDLSERLNFDAFSVSKETIERRLKEEIDPGDTEVYLHLLLNKEFEFRGPCGHLSISFSEEEVMRNLLLFQQAIDFTEEVNQFLFHDTGGRHLVNLEISIDETPFPTSPETHLFLLIVLRHRGVQIDALAPRFPGQFQKGIDYRGEIDSFREQFRQHVLIAQHYGNYKLSIHSGSDKFSIFPHTGELSQQKIHLKTAGTSWLEAVRLISLKEPSLYREIHRQALSFFGEASRHYSVTTDLSAIPPIESLSDTELPVLLDLENPRQLLHITYGFLLRSNLKGPIFKILNQYEEDYWSLLENHIEKHLTLLGIERGDSLCEA